MYKKGKYQLSCSPHLKVKQPLLLIINAWVLCRAWWNDIKNSCSLCCLLLLRKSFGLSIIRNGDLELITSGSQLKTMYRTYAVGVWWKLICMNSNFEDFCGHLVASQNVLAHQHQADGKLTLYRWNDWISSCFELLNRHFLPLWT